MRVLPYGEQALLCEVPDAREVPALRAAAAALDGVTDVVAGAETILVRTRTPDSVAAALATLRPSGTVAESADEVVLDVTYDGPDLDDVSALTGLSTEQIVAAHSAASYVVRFCGFAPGFAYLDGLDERLHVPRRDDPRTSVPAGSVAVAGPFAAVYPSTSPGGWRLLGTTSARLWDVQRDPPALLRPGTRVRFRPA